MTLTLIPKRKRAERLYFQISDDAGDIRDRMYTAGDPADRAYLLNQLADQEEKLALLHPVAFGRDPNPDEGGRDLAESLGSSATLLRALAATEDGNVGQLNRLLGTIDITESILWRRLASTRNHGERADLIAQVAEHAAMRVGIQAAEPLACLAHTERELANAVIDGRPAKAPPTMKIPRSVAALVFLAVGAVLVLPYLLPHLK